MVRVRSRVRITLAAPSTLFLYSTARLIRRLKPFQRNDNLKPASQDQRRDVLTNGEEQMKSFYTWTAQPAVRSTSIAELQAKKGKLKSVQVTANTAEEAAAAAQADFDMIICNSKNVEAVRAGDNTRFLTASIPLPDFATTDDILREAFRALGAGADAIMTARSMDVVAALAKEDIPVMGHLGLVPRKSTWTGGLRAVGKTAEEAVSLYQAFKRLEEAGGVMVEAEVIPANIMAEISKRTSIITVSLGSGQGGDVDYLFMEDMVGDTAQPPRHARAFGRLRALREEMEAERVRALTAFKQAVAASEFPGPEQSIFVGDDVVDSFIKQLDRLPK